jgi:hypothetical protein
MDQRSGSGEAFLLSSASHSLLLPPQIIRETIGFQAIWELDLTLPHGQIRPCQYTKSTKEQQIAVCSQNHSPTKLRLNYP